MALCTAWSSSRVILVSTSRPYPSTLRVQEPLSIRFLPCIAVIERLFPVPTRATPAAYPPGRTVDGPQPRFISKTRDTSPSLCRVVDISRVVYIT